MGAETLQVSGPELIKLYAKEAGVKPKTIREFLKAGIPISEIDEILDLRNSLTSYNADGKIHGQVTVGAVIKVYKRSGEDLEVMEEVFEIAQSLAGRFTRAGKLITTWDYNRSLYGAADQYFEGWG